MQRCVRTVHGASSARSLTRSLTHAHSHTQPLRSVRRWPQPHPSISHTPFHSHTNTLTMRRPAMSIIAAVSLLLLLSLALTHVATDVDAASAAKPVIRSAAPLLTRPADGRKLTQIAAGGMMRHRERSLDTIACDCMNECIRVGVIGSGMSGASSAYWLHSMLSDDYGESSTHSLAHSACLQRIFQLFAISFLQCHRCRCCACRCARDCVGARPPRRRSHSGRRH